MEGTSVVRLFQNSDYIFKQFSIAIKNIITNDEQKKEVEDYTMRYIKICTLLDWLFSLSRTLTGKITSDIIDKLEIVIEKKMLCWNNLRLSTKMVKIHGIEYHLLKLVASLKIDIKQAHQSGILYEKRTANMRDRTKASFSNSKKETISKNGECKFKIEQVRMQARQKQIKRKSIDEKTKKRMKIQTVQDECFEQCMNNNASKIVNYNLLPRVNK